MVTGTIVSDDIAQTPLAEGGVVERPLSDDIRSVLKSGGSEPMREDVLKSYEAILEEFQGREEEFYQQHAEGDKGLTYLESKNPEQNYYHRVENALLVERARYDENYDQLINEITQNVDSIMEDRSIDFDNKIIGEAIFQAHRVSIYNEKPAVRIRTKTAILKNAGLSSEAIRYLLDNGYCAKRRVKVVVRNWSNADTKNLDEYTHIKEASKPPPNRITTWFQDRKFNNFINHVVNFVEGKEMDTARSEIIQYFYHYGCYRRKAIDPSRSNVASLERFVAYNINNRSLDKQTSKVLNVLVGFLNNKLKAEAEEILEMSNEVAKRQRVK